MSRTQNLSVSEFMNSVKEVIDAVPLFRNVSIVGEVSNFTAHRSGHFYFSLKDESAVVRVVMFRSSASKITFKPKDGDKVIITGKLDVYPPSGAVQVTAFHMSLDGMGVLYEKFEALRKELYQKGWFDDQLKKRIPLYPQRIAVISGEGSAAHADITRTLKERWPMAEQVNYFAYVQGAQAIDDLTSKIILANEENVDVIILARGGGSIEDLWAFNELKVVEAVFNSKVPVISGVGHESDITLVDYVADYRAATPTAAAVHATPNYNDILIELKNTKNKMYFAVTRNYKHALQDLERIKESKRFSNPVSLLDYPYYRLDLLNNKLLGHTKLFDQTYYKLKKYDAEFENILQIKFKLNHQNILNVQRLQLVALERNTKTSIQEFEQLKSLILTQGSTQVSLKKETFNDILKTMKHLSPFEIMSRGYSVTTSNKKVIKSVNDITNDEEISIRVEDGTIEAKVIGREVKK